MNIFHKKIGVNTNLFKYKIFLCVVEMGSFTKAGEVLNLTQSAISHAISGLEHELGLTLLLRGRSGIRLTNNGERLMKRFREIVQMDEKLYQEVALIKGLEIGTVKIGTFSSVSIHWLPRILKKFNEQFPLIEVKLLDGNYHEIESWIVSGEADFGFVNLPTLDTLEALPLKEESMLCLLPSDHILGKQASIRVEQLRDEPFIMPVAGCDTDVRNIFSQHNMSPKIKYELEDDHAIMAMVQNGLGVSILPEMILSHIPYDISIRPLDERHSRTIGIATASLKNVSPAAKKCMDFITEWIN
ncbi:LysR substrate-binding domain-containing protein [Paenibacillus polymyxa]|uniref:LysR substrate-binding domain-containing protein n=1 Tax=Paenibacillus polymyxa TaxID=1406 RepID=UPI00234B7478|nr:LysR substrate-binding domain-containing protein [Paenibacillus polymyxa]WCM63410.1 LysR substrate-binding domain-containing protein [Paenibacillus polymyxa]